MPSLTSYSDIENNQSSYSNSFGTGLLNSSLIANHLSSGYLFQANSTNPSTAVALNGTDPKSLIYVPTTCTKTLWMTELDFAFTNSGVGVRAAATLYDRLSHQGGLVGNTTAEQVTNLPTAPLTRYTDGVGVQAFVEVYNNLNTIATTFTIKYTNQDGVANRVSQPTIINTNINDASKCLIPIALADGDTGVRSVESFTLAAAGNTAGYIGITLMKRLANFPPDTGSFLERNAYRNLMFGGNIVEVLPGAFMCLTFNCSGSNTGIHTIIGHIGITEK